MHSFFRDSNEENEYLTHALKNFEESSFGRIFSKHLCPGIFHCTRKNAYQKILKEKAIKPNDGSFEFSFPQTQNSFGYANSYISLFQFTVDNSRDIAFSHNNFSNFFTRQDAIIVKLSGEFLKNYLIPNSANPPLGTPEHKYYIPIYEVWSPKIIPLSETLWAKSIEELMGELT